MPTLCDANILLALSYEQHVHHPIALAWLNSQGTNEVVLCRITQLSLLRLLCNASVMQADVCSLQKAWSIYDAILADSRFAFQSEHDFLEISFRKFTSTNLTSPKLWQDAYLAAFAIAANLQLITIDRGFRQFSGLNLHLLQN